MQIYHQIINCLESHQLSLALYLAKTEFQKTSSNLLSQIEDIEQNYHFLTQYFLNNIDDPKRTEMIDQLTRDCFTLVDEWESTYVLKQATSYETKQLQSMPDSESSIFHRFWLNDTLSEQLVNEYWRIIDNQNQFDTCLCVSGLTFNLLRHFSEMKAQLLTRTINHPNERGRTRAMVGLILMLLRYENRLDFYPDLKSSVFKVLHDETLKTDWQSIISTLLAASQSKYVDEILNSLGKEMANELSKTSTTTNPNIVIEENDLNPKWENNAEIGEHMNAVHKLAAAGVDINFNTFSMGLNTDFFQKHIENWFLPFTFSAESLSEELDLPEEFVSMLCFSQQSNTGRYACYELLKFSSQHQLSKQLAKNITDMIDSENIHETKQEIKNLFITPLQKNTEIQFYIGDLHHFFLQNEFGFKNCFSDIQRVVRTKAIGSIYTTQNDLLELGDKCLTYRLFEGALNLYNAANQIKSTAIISQKIGLCLQKLGQFEDAIVAYKRAELLSDSNDCWALVHIAHCLTELQKHTEAQKYYSHITELEPDNLSYALSSAQNLMRLENYKQAFSLLARLELIHEDDERIHSLFAWCAFLIGKNDVALDYLLKLDKMGKLSNDDHIHLGHIYFSKEDRKKAYEHYHAGVNNQYCIIEDIFSNIVINALRRDGISETDIHIMTDLIAGGQHTSI